MRVLPRHSPTLRATISAPKRLGTRERHCSTSERSGLHCGRRSCRHRFVPAASSSEPPTSVGLACCPVGAWRRHLVKQRQCTDTNRHGAGQKNTTMRKRCAPVHDWLNPSIAHQGVIALQSTFSTGGAAGVADKWPIVPARDCTRPHGSGTYGPSRRGPLDQIIRAYTVAERSNHGR